MARRSVDALEHRHPPRRRVTAYRRGTLGGLTIVVVNNPTQHIATSDWSGRDGRNRNGSVLLDGLMGTCRVVVLHVFKQDTS